jgi:hypothetical protein
MYKILAAGTALILGATIAGTVFANDTVNVTAVTAATVDTQVASSADLTCMGTAVDVREGAVLTARTNFNAKIIAALTARRASLKTAYTIANNNDRKVAIKAALNVFAKANADARAQYKTDTKAAWKVFADSSKKCHVDADVRVKDEAKEDHDNGHHWGQLKKQVKNGFDVNANGKLDLDLGL